MTPIPRVSAKKYRGAGDVVAAVAKPVVAAAGVLGIDLTNCPGCKRRQEALNKAIPFLIESDPEPK